MLLIRPKSTKSLSRLLNRTFEEQELAITIDRYVSDVPWLKSFVKGCVSSIMTTYMLGFSMFITFNESNHFFSI